MRRCTNKAPNNTEHSLAVCMLVRVAPSLVCCFPLVPHYCGYLLYWYQQNKKPHRLISLCFKENSDFHSAPRPASLRATQRPRPAPHVQQKASGCDTCSKGPGKKNKTKQRKLFALLPKNLWFLCENEQLNEHKPKQKKFKDLKPTRATKLQDTHAPSIDHRLVLLGTRFLKAFFKTKF